VWGGFGNSRGIVGRCWLWNWCGGYVLVVRFVGVVVGWARMWTGWGAGAAYRPRFESYNQRVDLHAPTLSHAPPTYTSTTRKHAQEALERLSYETGVPKHRMFMACPSNLADFHLYTGVRIITH
jgi:hypothetical protein